jgi:ubiquitin carboxyl-terminal hydrolase 4/11/15
MEMREHSRRGLVGLENLGNTCFMNSCLQCLSHTLLLTKYFIDKSYTPEINRDNPIGSKGKLVQAYANFIKNMWCEEEHVYRPYRLKGAIADINKMFSGYAQHDSQELFSFLVDGIHEDLNRIKKKPYV